MKSQLSKWAHLFPHLALLKKDLSGKGSESLSVWWQLSKCKRYYAFGEWSYLAELMVRDHEWQMSILLCLGITPSLLLISKASMMKMILRQKPILFMERILFQHVKVLPWGVSQPWSWLRFLIFLKALSDFSPWLYNHWNPEGHWHWRILLSSFIFSKFFIWVLLHVETILYLLGL